MQSSRQPISLARGNLFGAEDQYVRLSLIKTQDDFDQLLHQVKKLISEESRTNQSDFLST